MSNSGKGKLRTPSGTVFEKSVGEIRSYFSPKNKKEENRPESNLRNKSAVTSGSQPTVTARSTDSKPKHRSEVLNIVNELGSGCEAELFEMSDDHREKREEDNNMSKYQSDQDMSVNADSSSINDADPDKKSQTTPKSVVADITGQLEEMMEVKESIGEPQTVDIATVHAMFKRLEEAINNKKEPNNTDNPPVRVSVGATKALKDKVDELGVRNKAVKGALQHMCDQTDELTERVAKLEMSNNKRAILITGLSIPDTKEEGRRAIDNFLYAYLGIRQKIEDYYEIGQAQPRAKVVMLHSLRDKLRIMRVKNMLKGVKNEQGKPYFINEYYAPAINESRRYVRQLIKENDDLESEDERKCEMDYVEGKFTIDGQAYKQDIVPPKPQKLLDISTQHLKDILKIPICRGPETVKDGNTFIGFTLAVQTLKEIEDAYFKMRICYPKARHIMCAYVLRSDQGKPHLNRGCCDDGEHSAGSKILEILTGNKIDCRVIFVVRMYSGVKIGGDRFKCILTAAEQCMELYPKNDVLDEMQYIHHDEEITPPTSPTRRAIEPMGNGNQADDRHTADDNWQTKRADRGRKHNPRGARGSYSAMVNTREPANRRRNRGQSYRGQGPPRGRAGYSNKRPRQNTMSPDETHGYEYTKKKHFNDSDYDPYYEERSQNFGRGGYSSY